MVAHASNRIAEALSGTDGFRDIVLVESIANAKLGPNANELVGKALRAGRTGSLLAIGFGLTDCSFGGNEIWTTDEAGGAIADGVAGFLGQAGREAFLTGSLGGTRARVAELPRSAHSIVDPL